MTDLHTNPTKTQVKQFYSVYQAAMDVLDRKTLPHGVHSHELATEIATRCEHFLDMSHFGAAQMIVGNTLLRHRPLSREVGYTTFGSWWRRLMAARHPDHECMCGWSSPGSMIEYHQADMINRAVSNLASLAGDR